MRAVLGAIGFLSIFPVGSDSTEKDLMRSPGFFPVVGILEGLFYLLLAYLSINVFTREIGAGLIVAFHYVFTGGFHVDGLSDTFDALAARAGRERKLEIMKERTAGPVGIAAIAAAVLLKYLFLEAVMGRWFVYTAILIFPIVAKWAMVAVMFRGNPARSEGLGNMMIKNTGLAQFTVATLILLLSWACTFLYLKTLWILPAFMAVYVFSLFFALVCKKNFGGLTGDNLGAISELSEIVFLMAVPLCLRFFS